MHEQSNCNNAKLTLQQTTDLLSVKTAYTLKGLNTTKNMLA